jgi:molybdate transport system substrate-binding protein
VNRIVSSVAVVALALGISSDARAQTRITLLSPDPLKKEVDTIVQNFERKTGIRVQESYGTGFGSRRTVAEGGALDVTLLFAPFDEALKTGNVDKSTQTVVARVPLAIAVKAGTPKPDISNAAGLKKLLLNAKSIGTADPSQGNVGVATLLAFDKLGITDQVKPKVKYYASMRTVSDEVAIGPYYTSEYHAPEGMEFVGTLPPDAAPPVEITGWIATNAPDKKAAMQLLDYFKSEEAAVVWEEAKIFPVTK